MNFWCCFVFIYFLFSSFPFSTGKRRARVRRPMTQGAARRIQSAAARALGGMVPKGGFAARAQSIADRRAYGSID